jgi:DNA-binding transcriptional LysR family regulator
MEALQTVRLFLKVAELGSLSAAGRASGLSPASVSRQIKALEQSLGVRLINRTSRRLALTEIGQLYRERGSAILEQLDDLTDRVVEHQTSPRGLIHLHTRTTLAEIFVVPAIPAFLTAYPDVRIKLFLSEEPHEVIGNKVDLAIRLGNLDEPFLSARKLVSGQPRILFTSPDYLALTPPIQSVDDLGQHNCLTWPLDGRFEDGSAIWKFRENGTVRELRVKGNFQVNSSEMLRRAVLAGLGIGLLPPWAFAEDFASGNLVEVLPDVEVTPTTFDHHIYAVFQRSTHIPRKVRLLIDHLVQFNRNWAPARTGPTSTCKSSKAASASLTKL